jgi:uncharacterized membrane protein YhhN
MNFQILLLIYAAALAAEIFANFTGNLELQYFSKPSLMPILIIYYAINTKKLGSAKYLIIFALVFSWLGDILLLLDKQFKSLFIYGLIAFLAAHIIYIFYFRTVRKLNNVANLPNPLIFVGITAYVLALFGLIAPHAADLVVPVAVYALVIAVMFAASLTAFEFFAQPFGKICVAGTFLFLISDSVLAINRFVAPFPLASVLIMLTYALAQLLIAEGSLRNLRTFEGK